MSEVLRSFFSYQVAVGSTMSEYMQVVDIRKSSVTSRSSFPSGAWSCHLTSIGFFLPSSPRSLPITPCLVPSRCLRKYSWPLPDAPKQIGAPDEQVARPVLRIVGVVARQLQLARLQGLGDIVLRLQTGRGRLLGDFQRIGLQLRRGRQPAHPLGAHVVVDQRAVPRAGRRRRRQNFLDVERLVAPLIGVGVERRGRIHLPRRTAPVEAEGERQPAGLRAQLFLADIMRPAAAGLSDATAHHQHVDDAAVVHVHVVPVVQPGADDDHRAAAGLLGIAREFARHRDDLVARHAGDLFRPGRRVGLDVVVALGEMFAAEAAIDAVIGDEQIVDRRHQRLAVLQRAAWPAPCA